MHQRLLKLAQLATVCLTVGVLHAQELVTQPTPFSVQLDLRTRSKEHPLYPIWLQDLTVSTQPAQDEKSAPTTVFRLLLRQVGELNRELLVRLFFEDFADKNPKVSAWSELGDKLFESKPLGTGVGLPTSASVIVPTNRAAYIEVSVSGDGANLGSLFLSSIRSSTVKQALDFDLSASLADPFGNQASPESTSTDQLLYGRVLATIDDGAPIRLFADAEPASFEFELAQQPLVALITFEVLNADPQIPVEITANERPLGAASMSLPDLADPAYQAQLAKGQNGDCHFRYNGWVKCQKLIPTSALHSGTNKFLFAPGQGAADVAVRSVSLQLKYPWSNAPETP